MDITLTQDQIKDMILALTMRVNYIQTGDASVSSDTATKTNQPLMVKPLSDDQMRAILRMKDTISDLRKLSGNARIIGV